MHWDLKSLISNRKLSISKGEIKVEKTAEIW